MSVVKLIKQDMQSNEFWAEMAKLEFVTSLNKAMTEKGVSKSDLARRIGKSPAYITKVMSGDANLTIESMVMLSRAVGLKFTPTLAVEPVSEAVSKVVSIAYRAVRDQQVYRHAQG
ncbi:helix-turn-helix domain-containing protein [Trichlorobacter lovleyi]|uniref:Transcriptional regulator, XRE family n=1 Tax=Trichlorobacter lovleyi (strain ATCC BAA-1151 / DSM 17278 / SZ) TaxID=398767 RepID=B3E291_TRIL1|nr:helix-turn-helix transcriptional regulator [Trichlorobacter lovleyi]ACD97194.1 transcriptional regulator, XRE family [Trichlorobacter lovleyi SZ]